MLAWKNKNAIPLGGFRFFQPETETLITAPHWNALVNSVRQHREANELPIDPGLEHEIEMFMCSELPDGCREVPDPPKAQITIGGAITFTKILAEVFLRGNPRVDLDEANRRAAICAKCPDNVEATGCKPCHSRNIKKLVERLSGTETTKHDKMLQSCRHCGCFNRVQVWFPLDVLQKNQREAVRGALPDKCWKK